MNHALHQLAGQALMVDLPGPTLSEDDIAFLKQQSIRAICLFRRNVQTAAQTQALTSRLRQLLGPEVLIGIDQEGGAVMRTLFLPAAPSAMALAAVGDEVLAYRVGAAVARGLAWLGINWNFAPVLDLNNNPHNPVIAERSFGADPERTARLAGAWLAGHLSEGVACCIKHFPGHGDTHTDSHLDLPRVDKPREALEQYELAPFRQLLAHSPALMSAHIVFPALDAALPATLSSAILGQLLRQEWGFQGVTITDGMNMKAIRERWGQAEGSVLALAAGADLSLVLQHREEMLAAQAALVESVAQGRLSETRLAQAATRVRAMAQRYPVQQAAYSEVQQASDASLFAEVWQRALTTVGAAQRPPLGGKVRLVLQADAPSDGVSEAGLSAQSLIDLLAPLYQLEVCSYQQRDELDWASLPQDGAFVLLASTTRRRYGAAQRSNWRPDLHLVLWNPYAAADIASPALISYGFAPPALAAVLAWLRGECAAAGQLPASLFG